jgi:GTP1/Obg family GTP-binding protein
MKIKDLIAVLQTKDETMTVYVATKDGYEQLGRVQDGKYFNTIAIATKVSLTVDQAEQMLYQLASYDNLSDENTADISRIIGSDRVTEILSEIKHYQQKLQEVRADISEELEFGDDEDSEDEITNLDLENN